MKISKIFTWKEIGTGCLDIVKLTLGAVVLGVLSLILCIIVAVILTALYPILMLLLIPGAWIALMVGCFIVKRDEYLKKEKQDKDERNAHDD